LCQAAAAALLTVSPLSGAALAGEFDLLAEGTPSTYVLDDAAVLNKTTKKSVGDQLRDLEVRRRRRVRTVKVCVRSAPCVACSIICVQGRCAGRCFLPCHLQASTGYHLEVATVRRLEFENDTFAFGDKLVNKWYPGAAKVGGAEGLAECTPPSAAHGRVPGQLLCAQAAVLPLVNPQCQPVGQSSAWQCLCRPSCPPCTHSLLQDKAGILLVVSAGKDGALTGGKAFMSALGDDLIDSIVGENIPILTGEEKYNETVSSSVSRVVARLSGKEDPGPPFRQEFERKRTYKTKAETEEKKGITSTIVLTLLFIACEPTDHSSTRS
jgi:uncharacterized membrane protein YgcG